MPYMGNTTRKASDIRRFDVTGSTSATHTLTWTAPNEQSLIVTVNGVKQHEDAYSVSGTTLTLTSALVSADKLEVIGINDIGTTITPAQNSVTADTIEDGAVTSAKILDGTILNADINASAAIAQSKVANVPYFTNSATAPSTPSAGDMWYDSTNAEQKTWDGSAWLNMTNAFSALGGTITTYESGGVNYKVHTFTSSSNFIPDATGTVDVMLVGGGGGGSNAQAGGGGGGGMITMSSVTVTAQNYAIVIGAGGAGATTQGNQGVSTTGFGETATGGGGGGMSSVGGNGANGGGGGDRNVRRLVVQRVDKIPLHLLHHKPCSGRHHINLDIPHV